MKTMLFLLAVACSGYAQVPDVIRIKGGEGDEKAVPFASRYRYDQFREGKVLYLNGTTGEARLNYNIVLSEMQFIDARGDTMALANESLLRMVTVGDHVFFYDPLKGYLEVVDNYPDVKLAVRQGLKVAKREKEGGYGQSTGSSAVTSYQFYSSGTTSVNKLGSKGDLVLIKDRTYFLVDQNNRAQPATKSGVLKIFSKNRAQVTAYLTRESVNFRLENDLKKLLRYCSDLPQ
ncbi:hypothetical protein [Spirosoma rigui]|uniref:hypothetical protein n=1 Tax=Spirosoma rigui TaxID=564064 RepID=UPI0012D2F53A|nr:hypothetical protein [Spirosoma rigui]